MDSKLDTIKKVTAEKTAEVKKEVKKAVKKTGAKAEAAKKTVKKTATRAAAKASATVDALKEEMDTNVLIQYGGQEAAAKEVVARVKEAYVNEGHKLSTIKSVSVYIKPEENAAYYVINKKSAGKIDLF